MQSNAESHGTTLWRPRGRSEIWIAGAVALAAILLVFAFRGVDLQAIWNAFWTVRAGPLVFAALLFSAASFARSLRWRTLLSARQRLGVLPVFWATMAGYLGNNFLPLRSGEILRTVLIGRLARLSNAFVLATALMERVTDMLILLVCLPFALSRLADTPSGFLHKLYIIGIAMVAGLALLPMMARMRERLETITRYFPLPPKIRTLVRDSAANFSGGLTSVWNARRAALAVGFSLAAWLLDCTAAGRIAAAMGLSLPVTKAFALLAMLGLSSALPSTPGYIGIYQFVAVLVLCPFGFSRNQALVYILVFQGVSYLQIAVWGLPGILLSRHAAQDQGCEPQLDG